MSIFEIVLLIIGIVIFAVSFLLPEKKETIGEAEIVFVEKKVKELVEKEIEKVRNQIEEVVDETITYSVEKTERALERLSNEKIMAVHEYSDTVLANIHKNHEEVMFLYDMLNQKQQLLKETALDAQKMVAIIETKSKEVKEAKAESTLLQKELVKKENLKQVSEKQVSEKQVSEKQANEKKSSEKQVREKLVSEKQVSEMQISEKQEEPVAIQFSQKTPDSQNNNEKILELHKAGKSKMVIAKELGLGVGEVKLVIDLFEGM